MKFPAGTTVQKLSGEIGVVVNRYSKHPVSDVVQVVWIPCEINPFHDNAVPVNLSQLKKGST